MSTAPTMITTMMAVSLSTVTSRRRAAASAAPAGAARAAPGAPQAMPRCAASAAWSVAPARASTSARRCAGNELSWLPSAHLQEEIEARRLSRRERLEEPQRPANHDDIQRDEGEQHRARLESVERLAHSLVERLHHGAGSPGLAPPPSSLSAVDQSSANCDSASTTSAKVMRLPEDSSAVSSLTSSKLRLTGCMFCCGLPTTLFEASSPTVSR